MIRVLIVDDHKLVRQGICALLLKAEDIKVVGEARDGQEALASVEQHQPDVVLMDIEMPRMDGLQATRELVARGYPGKIVMLSMRADDLVVRQSMEYGARGYLVKDSNRNELISAIRRVYQGEIVTSPGVAGDL